MCLFHFSTCFEQTVWYAGQRPAYQTATYTEQYIPDDVLMQLILLMMNTGLLETCREVK